MMLGDVFTTFTGVPVGLLVAAFVISTAAATVQGTIGFGFGLLSVPTLALLHPALSPVPQMLIVVPLVLRMAWRERGGIDWAGFWLIVGGRFPGAAIGVLLVSLFSRTVLDLVIAGIIAAAVLAAATSASVEPRRATRFGAGVLSGVCSYVAAIGGPPIALVYRDASGPTLRSTLAMVFMVGMSITLTSRTLAGQISEADLRVAAVLAPSVLLGMALSRLLVGRVEGPALRTAVLAAAALAAVALTVRTVA